MNFPPITESTHLYDPAQRREAIVLQAASVLALVPQEHKAEASRLLDDLIQRSTKHGAKIAQSVYREAMA